MPLSCPAVCHPVAPVMLKARVGYLMFPVCAFMNYETKMKIGISVPLAGGHILDEWCPHL